jgi:hypothetical protein
MVTSRSSSEKPVMLWPWRESRLDAGWIGRRPRFFWLFAAMVCGPSGQEFGLRDLVWHEDAAVQALAGANLAGFCLLIWLLGFAQVDLLERVVPLRQQDVWVGTDRRDPG